MPRPKNYAFEKAQRERARLARKAARKDARAKGEGGEDTDAPEDADAPEGDDGADKDPQVG